MKKTNYDSVIQQLYDKLKKSNPALSRKTFCTNMVNDYGYAAVAVMQWSGHNSLDEFLKFIQVDPACGSGKISIETI